jgi:hypothetical protein
MIAERLVVRQKIVASMAAFAAAFLAVVSSPVHELPEPVPKRKVL